jgi:hypothetical protein
MLTPRRLRGLVHPIRVRPRDGTKRAVLQFQLLPGGDPS